MATSPGIRSAKRDDSVIKLGMRLKKCWSKPLDFSLLPETLAQVRIVLTDPLSYVPSQ